MKKLLGLLAVAPMALAACGGSEAEAKASTDHLQKGKVVATEYFVGHGSNSGYTYEQNANYQVIEIKVWQEWSEGLDTAGEENGKVGEVSSEIYFTINESVGYLQTTAVTGDAAAKADWEVDTSTDFTTGANKATGDELLAANIQVDGADAVSGTNYVNTGESLRYAYDAVSLGDTMANFVPKTRDNYGYPSYDFVTNKNTWQSHLNSTFGTCDLSEGVTEAKIKEMARDKSGDRDVSGATSSESNLYMAAALTAAQTYCTDEIAVGDTVA